MLLTPRPNCAEQENTQRHGQWKPAAMKELREKCVSLTPCDVLRLS